MQVNPPPFWRLGAQWLWRDLRAGELRLLLVAVALAVAALTAVGFFADRIQGGLQRDARQLIGGDVVLRSDQPLPATFEQQALQGRLQIARNATFPTMGRASEADGGAARLVALKAVSDAYPLRGQLRIADRQDGPDRPTSDLPSPGAVWVDAALLNALGLQIGQTLLLGDSALRIEQVLVVEPDRGGGFMSFAPRVLMREADLAVTGLVQPASRVRYRLAVAGDDAAVQRYRLWAEAQREAGTVRGLRIESIEEGEPAMQQTLERAGNFLNLVALLAALLCAVAVAIAARGYAQRRLDDCALLRVLGLRQATMARAYALAFALAGLAATAVGVLLGLALHLVFVWLLADLVRAELPPVSAWPALWGLGVGLTLMATFGLPPVLQLAQVPPLRVIRRDVGSLRPASLAVLGLGGAGFALLLLAASRDLKLGLIAVLGFAVALALFAALAWLLVRGLRRTLVWPGMPAWLRLAVRQLAARPGYAVLQVSALAVGLLALVLLVLLRTDLIEGWRQATPPDAPNRFVINIQPEQAEPFQAAMRGQGIERFDWYPMMRGRLVAINGRDVVGQQFATERGQRLADREFNLSHRGEQPAGNEIVQGSWVPEEPGAVSVEEGLARDMGLKLGDELTFDMAGLPVQGRITSLRKVNWASMRVNFFVIFPVDRFADAPLTYISAFRAPAATALDRELVRAFPNITYIDMSSTLAQVQRVLGQVSRAVEFLFAFALLAGIVVLFAALSATRAQREREFAVMRAVGAGARVLARMQSAELLLLGLLAGALASGMAVLLGWALAREVFNFSWSVSPWVPLAGALAGALLAWLAGWWGLRGVLRTPVVQTLRRATL